MSEEFARVVAETRLGDPIVDALERMAERLAGPGHGHGRAGRPHPADRRRAAGRPAPHPGGLHPRPGRAPAGGAVLTAEGRMSAYVLAGLVPFLFVIDATCSTPRTSSPSSAGGAWSLLVGCAVLGAGRDVRDPAHGEDRRLMDAGMLVGVGAGARSAGAVMVVVSRPGRRLAPDIGDFLDGRRARTPTSADGRAVRPPDRGGSSAQAVGRPARAAAARATTWPRSNASWPMAGLEGKRRAGDQLAAPGRPGRRARAAGPRAAGEPACRPWCTRSLLLLPRDGLHAAGAPASSGPSRPGRTPSSRTCPTSSTCWPWRWRRAAASTPP